MVDIDGDDLRTFFAEETFGGGADARGGTRDDGYLVFKFHLCVTEPVPVS